MTVRRLERQREGTIRKQTLVPLVCVGVSVVAVNLWLRDDAPIVDLRRVDQ